MGLSDREAVASGHLAHMVVAVTVFTMEHGDRSSVCRRGVSATHGDYGVGNET